MHEKRFDGGVERLRSPERVARLEVERVVTLCLEATSFKNVLDVGTGSGLFAESFAAKGLEVTGVDVNPEMLAAARQFVPSGDFRQGTAEELPVSDASFDLVFYGLVLHESDDPLQALREARRVSRQRVCILEWPYEAQEFGPPLAHRLSPIDVSDLVQQAGFVHLESKRLSHLVLYCLTV